MSNNEIRVTYGIRLAELREEANLSADAIAKRLRIARSIVTDIELGQTRQIPKVFLRGYITSYAKLVNLPIEELSDYLSEIEQGHEKQPTIRHYSQIGKQKWYGKRSVTIGFCILLILLGITGFFLWQEYNRSSNSRSEFHLSEKINTNWTNH